MPPLPPIGPPFGPPIGAVAFTSAVTCATRFAFNSVACAEVRVPAVTAASIFFVSSATSAAMRASFLAPAIVASDSPALRRVRTVVVSVPSVDAITVSLSPNGP